MDNLTLHRSPGRHAHFHSPDGHPVFDSEIKSWIVTEPGYCERLLASADTRPATYSDDYEALEKRLGIDFSNVLLAFQHIPMCLHEAAHRDARRRVAEHIVERRAALAACVAANLPIHLGPLGQPGEVEIVREVLEPLVLSVTEPLTDVPPMVASGCRTASIIFDKSIGPRKRQRVDEELGRLREAIVSRLGAAATEQAIGLRLALAVLGRETLIGTLGESLHSVLIANRGRRLDEIDYPEVPPETGVPFIERIAARSFSDRETRFQAGDRIRIYLQAFTYSGTSRDRARIFGVGSHLCLGKALSLDLWAGITSHLARTPLYADVVSHELRTDNYVYLSPAHLRVSLHS